MVEAVVRIDKARRVQRAKVAKGHIRFAKDGRIVLETPFSDELLYELRALIQGRWDASAKHWHCAPCLQNVQKCELIARDFGVKLPEDWAARIKGIQPRGAISVGSGVIRISEFSRLEWPGHVWGFVGNTVLFEKSVCVKWDIGGTSESGTLPATSWNLERLQALIERSSELHFLRGALEKPFKRGLAVAARVEDRRWVRSEDLALGEVARQALLARMSAAARERGVMPHQLAGIRSLLELPEALLADEQGIGKTMQALLAVELADHYPLIVVCPAVARLNWKAECAMWIPNRRAHVVGVSAPRQGCDLDQAEIVILNYDVLAQNLDMLLEIRPKAVIFDEAQYLKTYDSERTQAAMHLLKETEPKQRLLLTGTPVLNRPSELLTLLTLLPNALWQLGGFEFVAARYCEAKKRIVSGWSGSKEISDLSGAAHLPKLAVRLRKTCLLRREKKQVLPHLADKTRTTLACDLTNGVEYDLAEESLALWRAAHRIGAPKAALSPREHQLEREKATRFAPPIDHDPDAPDALVHDTESPFAQWFAETPPADRHELLTRIGVLRQLAGVGKVAAAIAWIREFLSSQPAHEKLVVFAFHVDVQKALAAAFLDALMIVGKSSASSRDTAVRTFQSVEGPRVILCSLKAAQTALTLTAARTVLFVESEWTPAGMEQAEDRVHRIGQSAAVRITTLIAMDTIDERIQTVLESKRNIIWQVTLNHERLRDDTNDRLGNQPDDPADDQVREAALSSEAVSLAVTAATPELSAELPVTAARLPVRHDAPALTLVATTVTPVNAKGAPKLAPSLARVTHLTPTANLIATPNAKIKAPLSASAPTLSHSPRFRTKPDGTARQQLAGPGRPRVLTDDARRERNNEAKRRWKLANVEKQLQYARLWRAKRKALGADAATTE